MADQGIPSEEELLQMVREHWREHRPVTFAGLKETGLLEESIQSAVRGTLETVTVLAGRGMAPQEAWMAVREEWAFPPAEEPEDEQ